MTTYLKNINDWMFELFKKNTSKLKYMHSITIDAKEYLNKIT